MPRFWSLLCCALLLMAVAGCAPRTAPPEPAPPTPTPTPIPTPAPNPAPPAEQPKPGILTHHQPADLPPAVQQWADRYDDVTVGVAGTVGGKTYLLAAVEEGTVAIDSAEVKDGRLIVWVSQQGSGSMAIASTPDIAPLLAEFRWKSEPQGKVNSAPDILPQVYNRIGLPEAELKGRIAVLSPEAGQTVKGSVSVTGYARFLFEGTIIARLTDGSGTKIAEKPGTAGACCYDWGAFQIDLPLAGVAPGSYTLELGDYSPNDGAWMRFYSAPITVTSGS